MARICRWLVGAALAAGLGTALAAGSDGAAPSFDTRLDDARDAIEAERYADAIPILEAMIADDAGDADAHNLLGFALRKSGDVDGAFEHYRRALAIKPKHVGANEYLGELYVEQGDLERAREHLATIKKSFSCFFGCDEYDRLARAIEQAEAGG